MPSNESLLQDNKRLAAELTLCHQTIRHLRNALTRVGGAWELVEKVVQSHAPTAAVRAALIEARDVEARVIDADA
jgi:hypothetical protein